MRRTIRKAGLGLLIGATVILGGGFASADWEAGDETVEDSFSITYTVASFRALKLDSTATVEFETIRQGGSDTLDGPTLLYGTTWPADDISVYLDDPMVNSVALLVDAGTATPPDDLSTADCVDPGTSNTGVDVSLTDYTAADAETLATYIAEPLIVGIDDCGTPESDSSTDDQWATATTSFTVDATAAVQDTAEGAPLLGVQETVVVNFILAAGGD